MKNSISSVGYRLCIIDLIKQFLLYVFPFLFVNKIQLFIVKFYCFKNICFVYSLLLVIVMAVLLLLLMHLSQSFHLLVNKCSSKTFKSTFRLLSGDRDSLKLFRPRKDVQLNDTQHNNTQLKDT